MSEQPAASIDGLAQLGRELVHVPISAAEKRIERQLLAVDQPPAAMLRRDAELDRPVLPEAGRREEFGEALDIPFGVGLIELLHHQVMRIFVEQHRVGAEVGIVVAPGDISERARRLALVESGEETIPAGKRPHVPDGGHDEYRHAVAVADHRVVHLQERARGVVEAFEARGEFRQALRLVVGIDHEMLRLGDVPRGARRSGRQQRRQGEEKVAETHSDL